jgi:hypothetical protein
MIADLATFKPHMSVHEGDLSYARGSVAEWDQFMHQYEPIFRAAPYMTSAFSGILDLKPLKNAWPRPTRQVRGSCSARTASDCSRQAAATPDRTGRAGRGGGF